MPHWGRLPAPWSLNYLALRSNDRYHSRHLVALPQHGERPVGVHGEVELALDHLEHAAVLADDERLALGVDRDQLAPHAELLGDHALHIAQQRIVEAVGLGE